MAALMLGTVVGPRGEDAYTSGRFDLQARSREFLRSGLLISGAIHLLLLFAFLNLPGGGDDLLVRSYGRATEIFRQPISPPLIPVPPSETGTVRDPDPRGIPRPVRDDFELPPIRFDGIGPERPVAPGGKARGAGPDNAPAGIVDEPDPNRIYRIIDVQVPPVPIESPKPAYPPIAREAEITGRVVAEVLVTAEGAVAKVRVVSGNKILADAAQETLYRWRFRPAQANGRAVAVWVEIPVNFTL
jgi:periplasmic protein TonB